MERIEVPQNARSRATRAALLDAAWRVLEAEGASAATMERIADEAGVSRRAVYLHFPSRTDLLLALREHIDEVLDLAGSVAPVFVATGPGATIDAWAQHVAIYHARIAPLVRAIDQARRTDEDAAAVWDFAMQQWRGACQLVVERAEQAGLLAAPWTTSTATDLLWALMSVDVVEDLVADRGWPPAQWATHLSVLARRTLLEQPDAE